MMLSPREIDRTNQLAVLSRSQNRFPETQLHQTRLRPV